LRQDRPEQSSHNGCYRNTGHEPDESINHRSRRYRLLWVKSDKGVDARRPIAGNIRIARR
ncbi:MAG: hypothetical protein WAM44_02335, partial [Chthoniobacterales bacterium]